jgi:hypothetical protein
MCRDEICVPLPPDASGDGRIDLAAFWRILGRPAVHDDSGEVWVLGASPNERKSALAGEVAPDFTLPDLSGSPHRLSALQGNKVFLCTWASW